MVTPQPPRLTTLPSMFGWRGRAAGSMPSGCSGKLRLRSIDNATSLLFLMIADCCCSHCSGVCFCFAGVPPCLYRPDHPPQVCTA